MRMREGAGFGLGFPPSCCMDTTPRPEPQASSYPAQSTPRSQDPLPAPRQKGAPGSCHESCQALSRSWGEAPLGQKTNSSPRGLLCAGFGEKLPQGWSTGKERQKSQL